MCVKSYRQVHSRFAVCRTAKKLKTYNFPSNELGDYANKFIEHIKTKKRKNVTLLRYQHSMSNIVNGLSEKVAILPRT